MTTTSAHRPSAPLPRDTVLTLRELASRFNDRALFEEDPISFPTEAASRYARGLCTLQDVEITAVFAAHFAWGRRDMIVRDCRRLFAQMPQGPYAYVMDGDWRRGPDSIHRTVTWDQVADICAHLRAFYLCGGTTLEVLDAQGMRTEVYGQKPDPGAACKKIHMLRRWMVRRDGVVDLGLWRDTDPADLLIPLDTHVHHSALSLGLTARRGCDARTVEEITARLREVFPGDPCLGDFALFGYGVTRKSAGQHTD